MLSPDLLVLRELLMQLNAQSFRALHASMRIVESNIRSLSVAKTMCEATPGASAPEILAEFTNAITYYTILLDALRAATSRDTATPERVAAPHKEN